MSSNYINSLCELFQETQDNVTPCLHQDIIQKMNAAWEAKKYGFAQETGICWSSSRGRTVPQMEFSWQNLSDAF